MRSWPLPGPWVTRPLPTDPGAAERRSRGPSSATRVCRNMAGLDKATLAAIRHRTLDAEPFPPRVVVVRTGLDRQVQSSSVGYESTFGVDLYRI